MAMTWYNQNPKSRPGLLDPPRPLSRRVTNEFLHLGAVTTERDNELRARVKHLEGVIEKMGDYFEQRIAEMEASFEARVADGVDRRIAERREQRRAELEAEQNERERVH